MPVLTPIAADIKTHPVESFIEHAGATVDTHLALFPDYMQPGIVRFVVLGIKPGSFLLALFAGERELAERRADETNRPLVKQYFDFIESECPADCHGSSEKVRAWIERGGLIGRQD